MPYKENPIRPLADLKGKIWFIGKRKESIERTYEDMAPIATTQINPRIGRPGTTIGPLEWQTGEGHDFTAYCKYKREAIAGNFPNDVEEFVERTAAKHNIRVRCDLKRTKREEYQKV